MCAAAAEAALETDGRLAPRPPDVPPYASIVSLPRHFYLIVAVDGHVVSRLHHG